MNGALRAALRLGLRQARSGAKGFGIFLACIVLGVAAIAAVNSFSHGLVEGLAREGRNVLGGDLSIQRVQREAEEDVLAFLRQQGALSTTATTRAMLRTEAGAAGLVDVKAVEPQHYPVYGAVTSEPSAPLSDQLAPQAGVAGGVAEAAAFAKLDLAPGARVTFGDKPLRLSAILRSEPDRLAGGIGFGSRLIVSLDALREAGLVQPGSLIRWHYQVKLPEGSDDAALRRVIAAFKERFADRGYEIRSRANASPQLERQVERFAQYLTLIGLTALLVGGVGVANAVSAFLDRRRDDIATFKALGASGGTVVAIYLVQTAVLGLVGIVLGLILGAALPPLIIALTKNILPLPVASGVYPADLALAAAYGVFVSLAFALWPLGRAHDTPVTALFRDQVEGAARRPRAIYLVLCGGALAALAAFAIMTAVSTRLATLYLVAALVIFVTLRLIGLGLMALARRLPRPRAPMLRLALTNLHRPGAITPAIILSLGLGLTLLVIVALIDVSLTRQLTGALPDKAPSFFFVDIPASETGRFDAFLADKAPDAKLERVPMLRGRITAVKDVPSEQLKVPDESAWALSGDRGITFAEQVPEGSTLIAGPWWAKDYSGPPLVSVEDRIAKGLGLSIGDSIRVNVLGREIEAKVSNLRKVEWERLGIAFVLVFSPNTFRGAPVSHLATLTYQKGSTPEQEIALLKDVAGAFPSVSVVRVKDAMEAAGQLAGQLLGAIRGASAITLVASLLVLAGAIAATHRARLYDAVLLKTLGATRGRVMLAFGAEFLILALVTALFALLVGSVAAYLVVTLVMNVAFAFSWAVAAGIAGLSAVLTVVFGLVGTWRALSARPADVLRHL